MTEEQKAWSLLLRKVAAGEKAERKSATMTDAEFYAQARKGMIYRGQTVDEITNRDLLLEVIGWLAWGNADHEKYREQRYKDGLEDGAAAAMKPTIQELELILHSEPHGDVEIFPDGSVRRSK